MNTPVWRGLAQTGVFNSIKICVISQIDCLICLPDKSGNFLAFRAEIAQYTVKPEKTGFVMAIIARPRPVFCVFRPKIPRTFYFKLTEQSSRKKLAVGGFEPEKVRRLYPAPRKIPLLYALPHFGRGQRSKAAAAGTI